MTDDRDDEPTIGLRQVDPKGYERMQSELADRVAASDCPQVAALALIDAAIRVGVAWANPLDLIHVLRQRAGEIEAAAVESAVENDPGLLGPMQ